MIVAHNSLFYWRKKGSKKLQNIFVVSRSHFQHACVNLSKHTYMSGTLQILNTRSTAIMNSALQQTV